MHGLNRCSRASWIAGAVVGLMVLILLFAAAGYSFILALILASIVGMLVGFLLQHFLCRESRGGGDRQAPSPQATPVPPSAPSSPPKVNTVLAEEPKTTATPEPVSEQESTRTAPADSLEKDEGDVGPPTLGAARGDAADDLKRIKGVGPKLEASLNALGIFHFDQIAAWSESDVDWADEKVGGRLRRVRRDDWVAQARVLADGGETEFSKKVDKGDYY